MGGRERRYFIGNAEGVDQGEPQYRKRWRRVNVYDVFAPPEKVELEIDQPKMVKTYYKTCSGIDTLNKQRQHFVEIERYARTHNWWKHVCLSIFGMIIVNAMSVHQKCVPDNDINKDPYLWITHLCHEMINNNLDNKPSRSARDAIPPTPSTPEATHIFDAHLTPIKKKNKRGFTIQRW